MQLYVRRSDRLHGPYTQQKTARAITIGKLKRSDLIGSSSKGPWLLIADLADDLDSEADVLTAIIQKFGDVSSDDSEVIYAEVINDVDLANQPDVTQISDGIPLDSHYATPSEQINNNQAETNRAQFKKPTGGDRNLVRTAGISVLALFLICGLIGAFIDDDVMTASGARVEAEFYVRNQLKSPTTAVFTNTRASKVYSSTSKISSVKWEVSGNVDSQNGFGAMIRSSWSVIVHDLPDNKVKFTDLQISP